MKRPILLRLAPTMAVALVLSCTPTRLCGCPSSRTHAVAHGVVRTAAGAPVQSAFVGVTIYPNPCGQASSQLAEQAPRLAQTNAAGAYEARFHSVSGPRQACLRVSATRGQGASADSAATEGVLVQLRPENDEPARVRVDVVFPGS